MAYLINKENLWSESLTKDILTVYDVGIVCNNFDKKEFYNVMRSATDTSYVLKKSVGEVGEPTSINQLFFDEVSMISIHDGYISCSFGGVPRYLMSYRHVCAVITKREYYEPGMFHIRWYNIYNYYHGTDYGASTKKMQLTFCSHYSR